MIDELDDDEPAPSWISIGYAILWLILAACAVAWLCSCASVAAAAAAHPAELLAGWLLGQFLALQDLLALLFGF